MGILALSLGLALLAALAWAVSLLLERARLTARLDAADSSRAGMDAALEQQRAAYENAIKASAGDAMSQSSRQLLELARTTFSSEQTSARAALSEKVTPITEALKRTEAKLAEIERERLAAYERLAQQMRQVGEFSESLRKETGNLVAALRKPQVRGRYGEIQLKRVAELAGMRDYCDFSEQESARDDAGALKKPDMIVRLPNERCVVIDAKTNIEAYLDAIEATDPAVAETHLERFARHVADQAAALSKKGYWSEFDGAADFVVMFIPGDQFIDAALQRRPDLIDLAAQQRIILASPSTLIGLLRAVHVGWREKRLSDQANELFDLGRELHKRAAVAFGHADALGDAIRKASDRYNDFVGSVERQMMPTLRKFEEAGAKSDKELPALSAADVTLRSFKSLPAAGEQTE